MSELLPHYRRSFFDSLRERLAALRMQLLVVYGQPHAGDATRLHTVDLPWAHPIRNRYIPIGRRRLCWQPALGFILRADLVIVEQASRFLLNYLLFAIHLLRLKKMAFWGHGEGFHPTASGAGRRLKRFLSRRVHWWFAYNDLSAETVARLGFPPDRITSVQNAIDTRALRERREAIDEETLGAARSRLSIDTLNVGLFIGGMYADKRLEFLLQACRGIRRLVPDFEMIFVGSGPQQELIESASERFSWVHYAGVRLGADAVPYFMLSKLLLIPGRVGLAILDALSLEVPLVTTAIDFHSPEIAYLESGRNGIMVPEVDDPGAYARAVAHLLAHEEERQRLVRGCRDAAQIYTIEAMADRFAAGIRQALAAT